MNEETTTNRDELETPDASAALEELSDQDLTEVVGGAAVNPLYQ